MKKSSSGKRETRNADKRRKKNRLYLAVLTLLFVLAALLSFPPATASIRMFDAHGATENPATILLFLSFFSFPAVLLSSVIVAWIFYVLENYKRSFLVLLLPLLNVLGGIAGFVWLQVAYDGLFGGKS